MKYVPLVGIGLAVWGLVADDWFMVAIGVLLFFGGFVVDLVKKRAVLKNDKLFSVYRPLDGIIRIARMSIEHAKFDAESPKGKLAQGLFFMGMVDAASQGSCMNDRQFLALFNAVFHDLDFGDNMRSKVLLFHQSLQMSHPAYAAIMKGGEVWTKFHNGNTMIPVAVGTLLEEIVSRQDFPASVDQL